MTDAHATQLLGAVGKTRTLELADGTVIERVGGSVSWRNNNPGNLKFEFAGSADRTVTTERTREQALRAAQDRYAGVIGLDQWGNAVFESYEAGRTAKIQLLERKHASRTVDEMLKSYSKADYTGGTRHQAQAEFIYREGNRQGVNLRGQTIGEMSARETAALADGIKGFEGFKPGDTRILHGPTREAWEQAATNPHPAASPDTASHGAIASAAIYTEAHKHFFETTNRFEYGRSDLPKPGRDPSRLEQDLDGDGRRGVDCSAFVWEGLKNAGYNVPGQTAAAFTTHTLFNGQHVTAYAQKNFEVIPAAQARKPHGELHAGDLLLFSSKSGQHIGIFKGYDENGHLQYIGSQGSTGPAEVTIAPHGYWDARETSIVGALRAKPEFQIRRALHSTREGPPPEPSGSLPDSAFPLARVDSAHPAGGDGVLRLGDRGPSFLTTQRLLNLIGYRTAEGQSLDEDGVVGEATHRAVVNFQHAHALEATGHIEPGTLARLERERAQVERHRTASSPHGGPVGVGNEMLEVGDSGQEVAVLQGVLNRLGHHDARGHSLAVDGAFGPRTKEAVESFQRETGLQVDGRVGAVTRRELEHSARITGIAQSFDANRNTKEAHTSELERQATMAVRALDVTLGRTGDQSSERMAASLACLAKQNGLSRIDHVVLSIEGPNTRAGQNVFVVQGELDDPAKRRAHMATSDAIAVPVEQSLARLQAMPAQMAPPQLQVQSDDQQRVRMHHV